MTNRLLILVTLAALAIGPPAAAQSTPPAKSTLYSGDFDDYLMIAANHDANWLSGYYDDGKCRFYFSGPLTVTTLYQRVEFGEAYEVDSWDPQHPDKHFTTQIYSLARGGYQTQLTLEPGERDPNRPAACRSRVSLNRSNNVSNSFLAVRVVRTPRLRLYEVKMVGKRRLMVPLRIRPPAPNQGVWEERTWSKDYSPPGYVRISWYVVGAPRAGYVRAGNLYAPAPGQPATAVFNK